MNIYLMHKFVLYILFFFLFEFQRMCWNTQIVRRCIVSSKYTNKRNPNYVYTSHQTAHLSCAARKQIRDHNTHEYPTPNRQTQCKSIKQLYSYCRQHTSMYSTLECVYFSPV